MKKRTFTSLAVIALCFSSALAGQKNSDKKKEDKNAPRKIEINGDSAKVRAALIKLEIADSKLGTEEAHRIIFLHQKWPTRDVIVIADEPSQITVYATTEIIINTGYRTYYRAAMNKETIARLDKLLISLKTEIEGK